MAITGLSHATFVVSDLERASRLFREGLGAREVYDSAGREHSLSREKFFVLGGLWLVAMEGPPLAEPSYRHLAFAVDAADIPLFRQRLETLGVEILPGRGRIEGEGDSLYFRDWDPHLFELHAGTLEQRLAAYAAADRAGAT